MNAKELIESLTEVSTQFANRVQAIVDRYDGYLVIKYPEGVLAQFDTPRQAARFADELNSYSWVSDFAMHREDVFVSAYGEFPTKFSQW